MRLKSLVQRRYDLLRPREVCTANDLSPRRLAVGHSLGSDAKRVVTVKAGLHSRPCELRMG